MSKARRSQVASAGDSLQGWRRAMTLLDATIIRMVLVPATMQVLGKRAWWLPGWLDRHMPQFHIEAPADAEELPELPPQRGPQSDRTPAQPR